MSRKTWKAEKRRYKRFRRIIGLLEASNADPKHRNRKTRLRAVFAWARTDLNRDRAEVDNQ